MINVLIIAYCYRNCNYYLRLTDQYRSIHHHHHHHHHTTNNNGLIHIMSIDVINIVNKHKSAMAEQFILRQRVTASRFEPVIQKIKKVKGEPVVVINVEKTMDRVRQRLDKFTQLIAITFSKKPISVIYHLSVIVINDDYRMMHTVLPLAGGMIQEPLKLDMQPVDMIITKHAITRYLERNNSTNVNDALNVLGHAIHDCDTTLGILAIKHNLVPRGYCERQVKCLDGGIAIIILKDPTEEDYRKMDWILVTYLSPGMVKWWNIEAAESEYKDLIIRNRGDI